VASHLQLIVMARLIGLDSDGRARMLRWAASTPDILGVLNLRGALAIPVLLDLDRYSDKLKPERVTLGGWASMLFEAAANGILSAAKANATIIDCVAPSLDTTILADAYMLRPLSNTPRAFAAIKADRNLIPDVANEVVRLAPPIRAFNRPAVADYPAGAEIVRKGQRVLVVDASANRDERRFPDADMFEIRRNPRDQIGWGYGVHSCAGIYLARLELESLLRALVLRVDRVETAQPPQLRNNLLLGFSRLKPRLH